MNMGFPGGQVVKNPPANAGDMGSIPDSDNYRGWAHKGDSGEGRVEKTEAYF